MSKGQGLIPYVIFGIVGFAGSWLGGYILNGPEKASAAIEKVDTKVNGIQSNLLLLCSDYSQTVYRMDQNIQNVGKALDIEVVVGKSDSNPCKP